MPSRPCLVCGALVADGGSYCRVHKPIKRASPSTRRNRHRRTRRRREAVLAGAGRACQSCGASNVRLEVHHIKPVHADGGDEPENLMVLCVPCHRKIGREVHHRAG